MCHGFSSDRHRTRRAGVAVAAGNFFVFPRIICRNFAGEHEFRLRRMNLRPAGHPDADVRVAKQIRWKTAAIGLAAYSFSGNSFGLHGRDGGEVIVEGVLRHNLRALVNNFSTVRRGIEIRELGRQGNKSFPARENRR